MRTRPTFDALYNVALAHAGYFTTEQAAAVGYSPQALRKHVLAGRVSSIRHGIYRLVQFPAGDQEQLAILDLWGKGKGVFSHETALAAHGLSDVLPDAVHLTLPESWRRRRLRTPAGLSLHFDDVAEAEQTWFGLVRITKIPRTLMDCLASDLRTDLLESAFDQARRRGLLTPTEIDEVARALRAPLEVKR
ncbi:MAG: type IV toxin-antitoxin system AbiEi family antitoxin domain-containing protein [Myxococcota bacterium]